MANLRGWHIVQLQTFGATAFSIAYCIEISIIAGNLTVSIECSDDNYIFG